MDKASSTGDANSTARSLLNPHNRLLKRSFDAVGAASGLLVLSPIILVSWALAKRDTKASGIFRQTRIGRHGKPFTIYKLRTMLLVEGTTVTTANDARITPMGRALRRWKLDELPQLWNVLKGDMSLVGPRPDVPGFMDSLQGDDRLILELQPGITGPATLKYRNEEDILAVQSDPEVHNQDVIWPDKVRLNREYLENWSLFRDLKYILETIVK